MVRHGPGLEREQVLLGRFVDAGTELFAQAAAVSHAQWRIARGLPAEDVLPLVDLFCARSRLRAEASLRGTARNADGATYAEARRVLEGRYRWLEDGVAHRG